MYMELISKIYDATKDATGLSNRVFFTQVPQNTETPYAVYYLINQDTNRADSNSISDRFFVQFNVFGKKSVKGTVMATAAESIQSKMDALKNNLTISGHTVLDVKQDFCIPIKIIEDYWQMSIQYEILLDK